MQIGKKGEQVKNEHYHYSLSTLYHLPFTNHQSEYLMDNKLIIDIIGWIGSVLVVVSYASVSYDKIKLSRLMYQLFNTAGSLCLIVNTVYYHAFPSATVNVIWLGIALVALVKMKVRN